MKTSRKDYIVYMHTNCINQKKYVGITSNTIKQRWNNGEGYSYNLKFYHDIQEYGWNNFKHEVINENLTYKEARFLETSLINKFDLVKNGYNNSPASLGKRTDFNFYDFYKLNNPKCSYKNNVNYFTRIPNKFIQTNLHKEYGLNRIFLIVYILIDRNRSYENKSWITIGGVLNICNYKLLKSKPKIFYEVVKSLLFLQESYCIETDFDIYSINYNDVIPINIISENFDSVNNFTKLYGENFDTIMEIKSNINKENLLMVFLYINSYIGCRPRNEDGSERLDKPEARPEAFWRSIENMAKGLSMSKDTINQCINYLITSTETRSALLIKKEVGSIQKYVNKSLQNVPNIYVLNKEGYQQEIQWAFNKILEIYNVDSFDKLKVKSKEV